MNDFTPEQRTAIENLDCNLLVKAGAGAGKTRVLVERYIRILMTGAAETDGIVAITFTRKAAKEMKERIRGRVNELMLQIPDCEAWDKWRKVAQKLDSVPISTIHSLCSRILRENPAEAGIDPEFGLLEELDEITLLDDIWRQTLESAAQSGSGWLLRLLGLYSPTQLRQDFRPLFDAVLEEGLIGTGLAKALWPDGTDGEEKSREQLKTAYKALFEFAVSSGKLSATQEKLNEIHNNWTQIEQRIDAAAPDPLLLDELELPFKGMRGGADLREALQNRKAAAEALRGDLLDKTVERLVPDLCEWFQLAGDEWTRTKRKCRMLTYDDLEKETENLLLEHPDICERYNRRIRFLMVDECQDINERQRKIIYLLAGGDSEKLVRHSLFAVGDTKQSIYRFRGADTRVFGRVQKDVAGSGGKVIELLDNFRSHRHLVSAFNEFFAELMPSTVCEEEVEGADTVEYCNLRSDRETEGQAGIDLWVMDSESMAGADACEKEAEMIARRILDLVKDREHPVQYKDVAVLLRAFSRIAAYEKAFAKAGIPYYVAGSRGFGDRQEVADVLVLLRFLCNPHNEAALFGTLRSPFFQFSDETLLRLRRGGGAGGLWAGLVESASIGGLDTSEIAEALHARTLLEKWLQRRGFLTPGQLLAEAFDATGFDLLQLTQFMGVRRYANLQKLLDMAQAFMKSENGGLEEFISYVEGRAGNEGEAEIDSEAGDTVRIMTIHKSKGLEFPVVIVPDLQRKFNSRSRMTIFVRGAGMGLKVPDSRGKLMESGRFRKIARLDNALERAELKRVLYVAMTRAERQLILSAVANHPKTEKNLRSASGWLDWVRHLFDLKGAPKDWPPEKYIGEVCLRILQDDGAPAPEGPIVSRREVPSGKSVELLPADLLNNISGIPVGTARPMVLSPAYLSEYTDCPRRYFYSHICRMPDSSGIWRQSPSPGRGGSVPGVAPQQLGIAFHRFVELLPHQDVWRESLRQALAETLPKPIGDSAEETLREWAERYAESSLHSERKSIIDERREWAFQYRLLPQQELLPAVWLSGQVDCLQFYPDGTLGVIDYKTDYVKEGTDRKKIARYRLQLTGYALAARAMFDKVVRDIRIYFVRTGETVSIDAGADALKDAEEELQSVAGFIRSHDGESEYVCEKQHCPFCPFQAVCLCE